MLQNMKAIISNPARKTNKIKELKWFLDNVPKKAKIGFNIHGGISGNYAANVRMFETAGIGSLLITDNKMNIKEFYEPDKEIITYNSVDECTEKISWLLNNPEKMKEITKAGQIRTLKDHTIKNRVSELNDIINKELKN